MGRSSKAQTNAAWKSTLQSRKNHNRIFNHAEYIKILVDLVQKGESVDGEDVKALRIEGLNELADIAVLEK